MKGIYRSAAGEAEVRAIYDRALRRLDLDGLESRYVWTRFGRTHVLAAGPVGAPPVVVLPGGNFANPVCLAWFAPLARARRVLAPDIVGQPGRSAGNRRLSRSGDEQAMWTAEVLDGLGVRSAAFVGLSFGAGLVLRLAGHDPSRIDRAALVSPAGFVLGSVPRMLREVALPMLAYRLFPRRSLLRRAAAPILTDPDELELLQLGAVYRNVRPDPNLPRLATAEELAGLRAPVLVFAAERDPFFPGGEVLDRAREVLPNLEAAELLRGSRHVPSRAHMDLVNRRILSFLSEGE